MQTPGLLELIGMLILIAIIYFVGRRSPAFTKSAAKVNEKIKQDNAIKTTTVKKAEPEKPAKKKPAKKKAGVKKKKSTKKPAKKK